MGCLCFKKIFSFSFSPSVSFSTWFISCFNYHLSFYLVNFVHFLYNYCIRVVFLSPLLDFFEGLTFLNSILIIIIINYYWVFYFIYNYSYIIYLFTNLFIYSIPFKFFNIILKLLYKYVSICKSMR